MDLFELLDELENGLLTERDNTDPDTATYRVIGGQIAIIRKIRDAMDKDTD